MQPLIDCPGCGALLGPLTTQRQLELAEQHVKNPTTTTTTMMMEEEKNATTTSKRICCTSSLLSWVPESAILMVWLEHRARMTAKRHQQQHPPSAKLLKQVR